MIRSAAFLLALLGLALLGRLDRDGMLARANAAARVLGLEVRVEVRLERVRAEPAAAACVPPDATTPAVITEGRAPCE